MPNDIAPISDEDEPDDEAETEAEAISEEEVTER